MPLTNDLPPNPNLPSSPPRDKDSSPVSLPPLRWYLPTFHGDILLERKNDATTLVRVYELTATEEKALAALRKRATAKPLLRGQPWASEKEFLPVSSPQYRTKDGLVLTLAAPLEEVEKVLANALNPKGRTLFTAVKFTDGTIEKIARTVDPLDKTKTEVLTTYRDNAKDKHEEVDGEIVDKAPPSPSLAKSEPIPEVAAEEKKIDKQPVAAATAKTPTIGCPIPEFPEADLRATRALVAFLDERQIADLKKHGSFVSVGRDTGHRYLVSNREMSVRCRNSAHGQLYDLDEQRGLCVHDWDVPPPEEMLALHLCLSIPGYESYVRRLPHVLA